MPLTLKEKIGVGAKADTLRAELGEKANRFPINLDRLATHLGYTVSTFDPEVAPPGAETESAKRISGAIDRENKQIFINGTELIQRQFFTLAHELGHAVLHQDEDIVDYRDSDKSDPKEQEADLFAAELVMPEGKFYEQWYQTDGDKKAIASFFGVSVPAVNTRASWLGLK